MSNEQQEKCTEALRQSMALGPAGAENWSLFRANNFKERIIIADIDLSKARLMRYDFGHCYFTRVNFEGANLSGCDFSYSIFRGCNANNSNIEGANFRSVDMSQDGLSLDTDKFDETTKIYLENDHIPKEIHPGLVSMANQARAIQTWRRKKYKKWYVKSMLYVTDSGYSVRNLMLISLAVVVLFAAVFAKINNISNGVCENLENGLKYSIGYFLSINAFEPDKAVFFVGSVESFLGMVFFSIFTAILVTKFFGKS